MDDTCTDESTKLESRAGVGDMEQFDQLIHSNSHLHPAVSTSSPKKSVLETPSPHKPFSHPPPEILHLIFERTIPLPLLLDSSLSFSHNSLFCQVLRQKKAIINVCRTWYRAGLPFLYECVYIRRVYQLLWLLRTLVHSPRNMDLKKMIKTIDIYCHVPDAYGKHFERQLRALLCLCHRVASCNFRSSLPFTTSVWHAITNITQLSLPEGITLISLESILSLISPRIESLSFHIPRPDPVSGLLTTTTQPKPVHFPALRSVSIGLPPPSAPILDGLLQSWGLPELENLTFLMRVYRTEPFRISTLANFCTSHGQRVRYLHFVVPWPTSLQIDIQPILNACPALEHIVLSSRDWMPLAHTRVRWVDVWDNEVGPDGVRKKMEAWVDGLRALERVRVLPCYLRGDDAHSVDIPLLVPPCMVVDPKDAFECMFLGVGIRHEVGEIRYIQPGWRGEHGKESEDEKDEVSSESEYGAGFERENHFEGDGEIQSDFTDTDDDSDSDSEADEVSPGGHGDQNEIDGLETDFPWLDPFCL
ncbi:hypothetical protein GALMADRAFT_242991 [Galerina marginata CBS 339.88]|uniref:F-box domain-containing protein n=1 Tax=Galerina marginata (strain CBS 339.88) TaxID=685588 RepID=A0A067T7F5_GALM3|nr:hypothetical protein GALMADRAFT_242991 [Galerina marginata CBS 339.88]